MNAYISCKPKLLLGLWTMCFMYMCFASWSGPFSLACLRVLMKSEPLSAEVIILWSFRPWFTHSRKSQSSSSSAAGRDDPFWWNGRGIYKRPTLFSRSVKIWNSSFVCDRVHYSSYLASSAQGADRSAWQARLLLLFLFRSASSSSLIDGCWEGLMGWHSGCLVYCPVA